MGLTYVLVLRGVNCKFTGLCGLQATTKISPTLLSLWGADIFQPLKMISYNFGFRYAIWRTIIFISFESFHPSDFSFFAFFFSIYHF
jgi:hypothetical protein